MFFSATHIDVKLNQDYADFRFNEKCKVMILCDGIGEFKDSGTVARKVVELFLDKEYSSIGQIVGDKELLKFKNVEGFEGGTTCLIARNQKSPAKLNLEYLGNGGIIHLYGDYRVNPNSNEPYRYSELMNPHVNSSGALIRHISHTSQKEELKTTKIEINLNSEQGDIVLLFSDGLTSLEDKIIVKDDVGRYWRNESPALQFVLSELDIFLSKNYVIDTFQDALFNFNIAVLGDLKSAGLLEDDASLGIIISEEVLNFHKSKAHD